MQKQAPSVPRILAMVIFALSCFGLLLFLWLSFGGPVPLKPEAYRIEVGFPEATQLSLEADVRVAGVSIGKVRGKRPEGNRTIAELEIERRYAPIARDARATLRQKTLLGETYVEMTTGSRGAGTVPEGGRLANRQVLESIELDEILNSLDPFTRRAFRTWQQSLSQAIKQGRGQDLNDAFGNLPGFVETGGDLLQTLDEDKQALQLLIRNTGVVFAALTEREDQLRNLVNNSDDVFTAIQSEKESFAQVWQVFPTFLDESRFTYDRLRKFAIDTRPLFVDLTPAIEDLGPTLRAVGDFAPDLQRFFRNLDPLLDSSKKSLPALREILLGLRPVLGELGPWLQQVNPILEWIGFHQHTLTDMLANLGVATHARTTSQDPRATGHYLRQFGPSGTETIATHPRRLSSNRGNAYYLPLALQGQAFGQGGLPAWDCVNAGGPKEPGGEPPTPRCRLAESITFQGVTARFPHVTAADYSAGRR
jgi:phospholipid/cholesterol/gamma-HCH transport system substrate-binding protein